VSLEEGVLSEGWMSNVFFIIQTFLGRCNQRHHSFLSVHLLDAIGKQNPSKDPVFFAQIYHE